MGFERKNHRKDIKKAVTFDYNCLIFSGATRNRDKFTSNCISLLFRNSVRVISSYCSTVGLQRFAHRGIG